MTEIDQDTMKYLDSNYAPQDPNQPPTFYDYPREQLSLTTAKTPVSKSKFWTTLHIGFVVGIIILFILTIIFIVLYSTKSDGIVIPSPTQFFDPFGSKVFTFNPNFEDLPGNNTNAFRESRVTQICNTVSVYSRIVISHGIFGSTTDPYFVGTLNPDFPYPLSTQIIPLFATSSTTFNQIAEPGDHMDLQADGKVIIYYSGSTRTPIAQLFGSWTYTISTSTCAPVESKN